MKYIFNFLLSLLLIPFYGFGQSFNIGEQTITYIDSLRNRPVKVEIWYPTNEVDPGLERKTNLPFILEPTIRDAKVVDQKFPLVLLSHGSGGNRFGLAWLAIALVKHGYIVAAPDHWGNTFDNKIPEYFVRYWERPLDISFLINKLLVDKTFSACINKDMIGMAGFSFGGYTSLALAGADLDCIKLKTAAKSPSGKKEIDIPEMKGLGRLINDLSCGDIQKSFKDNRIKTFVALAPALGLGFGGIEQTRNITSPVLIIGVENDQIVPVKTNAENYNKLIPHSKLLILKGMAGHYVFLCEGDDELQKEAKIYYKDDKSVSRREIHNVVEKEVIEFLQNSMK